MGGSPTLNVRSVGGRSDYGWRAAAHRRAQSLGRVWAVRDTTDLLCESLEPPRFHPAVGSASPRIARQDASCGGCRLLGPRSVAPLLDPSRVPGRNVGAFAALAQDQPAAISRRRTRWRRLAN